MTLLFLTWLIFAATGGIAAEDLVGRPEYGEHPVASSVRHPVHVERRQQQAMPTDACP